MDIMNSRNTTKSSSRFHSEDMSPGAISKRLDTVNELNAVGDWLGKAVLSGGEDQSRPNETKTKTDEAPKNQITQLLKKARSDV